MKNLCRLIVTLYLLELLSSFSTQTPIKNQVVYTTDVSEDPLANLSQLDEFMQKKEKIFVTIHKYGKNFKKLDKSSFKSFLEITKSNPHRIDLLTQFLNLKTYQNFDRINMMSIPELRKLHSNYVKVLKYYNNPLISGLNSSKYGLDHCDLVKMAEFSNLVSICPWHWSQIERQDRFPFKRFVAICNCKHCQASTIFDKDVQRVSMCKPEFSIKPVLNRESVSGELERWNFYLEEVPTSCVCTIKLNPH